MLLKWNDKEFNVKTIYDRLIVKVLKPFNTPTTKLGDTMEEYLSKQFLEESFLLCQVLHVPVNAIKIKVNDIILVDAVHVVQINKLLNFIGDIDDSWCVVPEALVKILIDDSNTLHIMNNAMCLCTFHSTVHEDNKFLEAVDDRKDLFDIHRFKILQIPENELGIEKGSIVYISRKQPIYDMFLLKDDLVLIDYRNFFAIEI